MPVDRLDQPCPARGKRSGGHTLDEWASCLGEVTLDTPAMEVRGSRARQITEDMQRRFKLDRDIIVADHVDVKAFRLEGFSGIVRTNTPTLLMEFGLGIGSASGLHVASNESETVAKVGFSAEIEGMLKFGELIHSLSVTAVRAAQAA